jgi:hypothetical protein
MTDPYLIRVDCKPLTNSSPEVYGTIEIRHRRSGRSYKLPPGTERIKSTESSELLGKPLDSATLQTMMEILNGGPEMPRTPLGERWDICKPKTNMGKIFIAGTGENL